MRTKENKKGVVKILNESLEYYKNMKKKFPEFDVWDSIITEIEKTKKKFNRGKVNEN